MTTPPADAPGPTDLDRLFAQCVEAAGRELADGGEFWPFALAVTQDGELVSPEIDPGPRPDPGQVVLLLRTALRRGADQLRAVAVCSDVRISQDGRERDAVRIELEAREGEAVALVVPYEAGPQFEQPVGGVVARSIWT